MGKELHTPARRVDPAARAVTALGSRGLLASLRGVGGTKSLFSKVSKFVAAFGALGVRNRVGPVEEDGELSFPASFGFLRLLLAFLSRGNAVHASTQRQGQ